MIQRYRVWWDRFFRQECFDKDTHGDWVRHQDVAEEFRSLRGFISRRSADGLTPQECVSAVGHIDAALEAAS